MMSRADTAEARSYHHGDLRRALIDATRGLLEREGPGALSLRAAAREAGVSPAAPYHHFKDKNELLEAVADEGWELFDKALADAKLKATSVREILPILGVAYVQFAIDHPALYRLMYDNVRNKEALPQVQRGEGSAFAMVRASLIEAGADPNAIVDLELANVAAWCAAHGLAEMASFRQFEPLKEACGGETEFIRAVFSHLGFFPKPQT